MADDVRLCLLGTIEVQRDNITVSGFESRKAVAILGYLAARGEAVQRSQLADMFWGDKPEARGRGNLSRVLHNLNTLLPGCLRATRETVLFSSLPGCWLDMTAFTALAAREDPVSLAAAAELFRGDLMAGLSLDDCPEFDMWLATEQEMWRQRMAQVLDQIITFYGDAGHYQESLRYAARRVALDPWREESHRRMMVLLALSGQRSAALKQYETCRRILATELDVAPATATTALYERILKEEIRRRPVPASGSKDRGARPFYSLPSPPATIPGRETDVAQIADRLQHPECRLLSLVGPRGAGTIALGLKAAATQADGFHDGICYVDKTTTADRRSMAGALARVLHITPANPEALRGLLFAYLRDKEMLIIFPEADSGSAVFFEDILKRAPRVKIMLTASAPVNSWAEWIYDVAPGAASSVSRHRSRSA